jgi:hypothetical protein
MTVSARTRSLSASERLVALTPPSLVACRWRTSLRGSGTTQRGHSQQVADDLRADVSGGRLAAGVPAGRT